MANWGQIWGVLGIIQPQIPALSLRRMRTPEEGRLNERKDCGGDTEL